MYFIYLYYREICLCGVGAAIGVIDVEVYVQLSVLWMDWFFLVGRFFCSLAPVVVVLLAFFMGSFLSCASYSPLHHLLSFFFPSLGVLRFLERGAAPVRPSFFFPFSFSFSLGALRRSIASGTETSRFCLIPRFFLSCCLSRENKRRERDGETVGVL